MTASRPLPPEMEVIRAKALRALREVRPVQRDTRASSNFWADAKRIDAGRRLPEYYLVYFLLVDLLGFPHKGAEEKGRLDDPARLPRDALHDRASQDGAWAFHS